MASTVSAAFAAFLRDSVNLAPSDSQLARKSRTWLRGKLAEFSEKHDDFPNPFPDSSKQVDFGSFSRRTKIRELDDVDLIHCLTGEGATYLEHEGVLRLTVPSTSRLYAFRHPNTDLLDSRRVINRFVKALKEVPQYSSSEANRRGEAAVLRLTSRPWDFDILPGFFTAPESSGRTYYVIPNGSGHWKKTDPRRDREWVTSVNQKHEGRVLNIVRVMKFWQRRPTMPWMAPYSFECMVVNNYDGRWDTASDVIDSEIPKALDGISSAVHGAILDPKDIQGDLNSLGLVERLKIAERATSDATKAREARKLDEQGETRRAIAKWQEVFGPCFPDYTG